jgi:hypothetical protein
MNIEELREVIYTCAYPGYRFTVRVDGRGAWYLQADYLEQDTVTRKQEMQLTRRWFLNPEMTRSEVVQTVFKCILTSMEHRAREWFTYKAKPIFGPHFDVDKLWELAGHSENYSQREVGLPVDK